MIRSFDWRDVGLVNALSQQGVCLDSETGLIRGNRPLQIALLAYLMPGAGDPTLIWKDKARAAFGQLRHRPNAAQARMLYIAHQDDLFGMLRDCEWGRSLAREGFAADLEICAQVDLTGTVPVMRDGRLVAEEA